MNNDLIRRRKLLFYLGLGTLSLGTATAAIPRLKNNGIKSDSISALNQTQEILVATNLPNGGHLPEFRGISQWLNSPSLSINELRGNVVLIQFWTFACINCQRTLPYITKWYREYASHGLKIVGIHTPEFPFERDPNNVRKALIQHQIKYPVPMDNDFKTWNEYKNEYWPHLFLADRQGVIRYDHIGEGAYEQTEGIIRRLLG